MKDRKTCDNPDCKRLLRPGDTHKLCWTCRKGRAKEKARLESKITDCTDLEREKADFRFRSDMPLNSRLAHRLHPSITWLTL